MIASNPGEFEAGFGREGSTKEHMQLANTLGVKKMIVCCNKMDRTEPPYSEARFKEIMAEVKNFLKSKKMFKKAKFIPISGWVGDNMLDQSENTLVLRQEEVPRYDSLRLPRQDQTTKTCYRKASPSS